MAAVSRENWVERIRDPKIECMSRDEMAALQSRRLVEVVNRVYNNVEFYRKKMQDMGIHTYIGKEHQGPIITTFYYPEHHKFSFQEMYAYIKERGHAIYPGKVTDADTFRIGNIGEIYEEDILKLTAIFKDFFAQMNAD